MSDEKQTEKEGDAIVRKLEELGKKKESQPPLELTNEVVAKLARMGPLEYAQSIGREAKKYRVSMRLLEKAVDEARTGIEVEKLLQPHWEVTPANDPVDAAQLFAEIEARILRHVVMPKDLAFVVALCIGQSWIHEHATHSPILGITSAERDSGKSTLMGVISFLVRRSFLAVDVSAAVLYRSIEKWSPTFVIDEADDAFKDSPDLRQVINSGWTRGSGVPRCDPDTHEPRLYSTFCAKIIALKGRKMPDTMLSRVIFIMMKRRLRGEKIAHFNHLDDAEFQRMRSQLARWARDNGAALGAADPIQPEAENFINRTASNWRLLFAIADSLGAGKRARDVAQHIAGMTDMASAGAELLKDVKAHFDASTLDYAKSKLLIDHLAADPEKPWAEWSRGKPITEKGLAALLHEFGIASRTVGPRGNEAKGYRRADFEDAWERYLGGQKAETQPKADVFPSKRRSPSDDYIFAEKTAVEADPVRREKNGGFSSEINAFDVSTGEHEDSDRATFPAGDGIPFVLTRKMKAQLRDQHSLTDEEISNLTPQQAHDILNGHTMTAGYGQVPSDIDAVLEEQEEQERQELEAGDDLDFPVSLRRSEVPCNHCGKPATPTEPVVPCDDHAGGAGYYHLQCWASKRTGAPALGPEGDSLDDFN